MSCLPYSSMCYHVFKLFGCLTRTIFLLCNQLFFMFGRILTKQAPVFRHNILGKRFNSIICFLVACHFFQDTERNCCYINPCCYKLPRLPCISYACCNYLCFYPLCLEHLDYLFNQINTTNNSIIIKKFCIMYMHRREQRRSEPVLRRKIIFFFEFNLCTLPYIIIYPSYKLAYIACACFRSKPCLLRRHYQCCIDGGFVFIM